MNDEMVTTSMRLGFAKLRNQTTDGPEWEILDLTPYLAEHRPEPEDDNPIPEIGEAVLPASLEVDGASGFDGRLDYVKLDGIEDGGEAPDYLDDDPEDTDGEGTYGDVPSVLEALEDDGSNAGAPVGMTAGPALVAKLGGVIVHEVVVAKTDGKVAVVDTDVGRFGIGPFLDAAILAFAAVPRYVAIPCQPSTLFAADAILAEIAAASDKIANSGVPPADHIQIGGWDPATENP